MKWFIAAFALTAATAGKVIEQPKQSDQLELNPYQPGDRFFYYPMDDDSEVPASGIELVDTEEPVDEEFIESFSKEPHSFIVFYLYTRNNPTTPQVIQYRDVKALHEQSHYDGEVETVVIKSGWRNRLNDEVCQSLKTAFLANGHRNVILVDWSHISFRSYPTAAYAVPIVAKHIAYFLRWLHEEGKIKYEKLHLVGFSLGAHTMGNVGRNLGGHVQRITALDAASPLFYFSHHSIKSTDAKHVEAFHTEISFTGIGSPYADVDHYPNGGAWMPGCGINLACSHNKAHKYMVASLIHENMVARQCSSYIEAISPISIWGCRGAPLQMGNGDLNKIGKGIYRMSTGASFPFA